MQPSDILFCSIYSKTDVLFYICIELFTSFPFDDRMADEWVVNMFFNH